MSLELLLQNEQTFQLNIMSIGIDILLECLYF